MDGKVSETYFESPERARQFRPWATGCVAYMSHESGRTPCLLPSSSLGIWARTSRPWGSARKPLVVESGPKPQHGKTKQATRGLGAATPRKHFGVWRRQASRGLGAASPQEVFRGLEAASPQGLGGGSPQGPPRPPQKEAGPETMPAIPAEPALKVCSCVYIYIEGSCGCRDKFPRPFGCLRQGIGRPRLV